MTETHITGVILELTRRRIYVRLESLLDWNLKSLLEAHGDHLSASKGKGLGESTRSGAGIKPPAFAFGSCLHNDSRSGPQFPHV